MRIPTLGALTLAAAAAVVAVPTAANAAPVANADSAQAQLETKTTVNVLANDIVDTGTKTLSSPLTATPTPHGTVTCAANGDCDYTPASGYTGSDSFQYTMSDGTTASAPTTVTITTFDVGTVGIAAVKTGTTTVASALRWPDKIDLSTTVKSPSGALLSGVEVTLFAKPATANVYSKVVTRTTTQGVASYLNVVRPDTRTSYQWRTTAKQSSTRTVTVAPTLTATFDKKRLPVGDATVISGVSAPATAGDSVLLQKLTSTGSWITVDTAHFADGSASTAAGTGAPYSFNVPASAEGSSTYRVRLPAQSGRDTVTGAQTVVRAYMADVTFVEPGSAATHQDEWVKISNPGTRFSLQLAGWKLSDGTETLKIPANKVVKVAPGDFIKVHTGSGRNNTQNLYLNRDPVWNNNSGDITVKDNNGIAIDATPYHYPVQ